jgi:glycosyltransferase involved in cell wall biosynthesis
MRVLFLAHSYPRRAGDSAGSFLLRLAVGLRERGIDVRVLAPAAAGLASEDVIEGVPVARYRYAPRDWETLAYTGNMAADVAGSVSGKLALAGLLAAGTARTALELKRWRPDVVHAHWWFPAGLVAMLPSRFAHVPMVTTMHGSDVRLALGAKAAHGAFRRVLGASAAVTAVSSWLATQANRIAPDAHVEVAPMPVRAELFAADAAERSPEPRFLFVGRLNEQKGITHLVRALAAMRHRASLDVVGDGPDAPALRHLTADLGVADRVRWLPSVQQEELPALYRRATALVLPSREEGLGLVAVEAHLSGTPVVGSDSGGIPDVVRDGQTGLLVTQGDPRALAHALDTLLDLPDRGAAWGQAGRVEALARFTPAAVAARYAALYERAIAEASRRTR